MTTLQDLATSAHAKEQEAVALEHDNWAREQTRMIYGTLNRDLPLPAGPGLPQTWEAIGDRVNESVRVDAEGLTFVRTTEGHLEVHADGWPNDTWRTFWSWDSLGKVLEAPVEIETPATLRPYCPRLLGNPDVYDDRCRGPECAQFVETSGRCAVVEIAVKLAAIEDAILGTHL